MALCAVIGGADHWTEVVEFAQARQAWFATFLELSNGIPSHDTFARVFRLIDTVALEQACQQWLRGVAGRVEGVVAIDGKSVRGSRDGKAHPLHIVSAWASLANDFARQAYSHHLEPMGPRSHGRIERREHWVVQVPRHLQT